MHSIFIGGDLADLQCKSKLYGGSLRVRPAVFTTLLTGLKAKLGSSLKYVKSPAEADISLIVTGWTHAWFEDMEGTDRKRLTLSHCQIARIKRSARAKLSNCRHFNWWGTLYYGRLD